MLPVLLEWHGQRLWLSPGRCMYWEEQRMLVLSDLHIGKAAHFRKAGIPIPQQVFQEDLLRLFQQVHLFKPEIILVTGDLFHSRANAEHDWFARWREALGSTKVLLVKGNHEILQDQAYEELGIEVVGSRYECGPFCFSHDMTTETGDGKYLFSGHVHPGVKISGKGKQSVVLPCFHFMPHAAILPAFSHFSGKHLIESKKGDQVFAILDGEKMPSIILV